MTDTVVHVVETLQVVEIESVEVGLQGPKGVPGESGFTVGIDIISGGAPDTDYSEGYIFFGGNP